MHKGHLRHLVLIIEGTKYELKQEKDSDEFMFRIKKHTNWTAELAKRNAALKEKYKPEEDGRRKKYVCLIGWTRLSPPELEIVAKEIFEQFGEHHVLWNNCQTILQDFSDKILDDTALDYPWFREHTRTEFQQNQEPPHPPIEMTIQQNQILRESHNQHNIHQIQHDLEKQQLIVQQQIQRDTGMNADQMQWAMNPAPDPGFSAATSPALILTVIPTIMTLSV